MGHSLGNPFLSALAGKSIHLLHRTKGVFIRALRFPIYLPSALFSSNSLFIQVTFLSASHPILISYFGPFDIKDPFIVSLLAYLFLFFLEKRATRFRQKMNKIKRTAPFVIVDSHFIKYFLVSLWF